MNILDDIAGADPDQIFPRQRLRQMNRFNIIDIVTHVAAVD